LYKAPGHKVLVKTREARKWNASQNVRKHRIFRKSC